MSIRSHRARCAYFIGGTALLAGLCGTASAQTSLPEVVVQAPKQAPGAQKPKPKHAAARQTTSPPTATAAATPASPAAQLAAKSSVFDQARSNLYTTIGTNVTTIGHDTIEDLPQGSNATVEKVLLQAPGRLAGFRGQRPAACPQRSRQRPVPHQRRDAARRRHRLRQHLDTSLIGSIALITGALPAEYGLRTVGLVDIKTRTDAFNNSGSVSMYGGSQGTITPSFEYGGTFGGNCPATTTTDARHASRHRPRRLLCRRPVLLHRPLSADHGRASKIRRPRSSAIHDFSQQEKGFAYMSAFVDPTTRVSLIAGTSDQQFPNSQHSRPADRT